MKKVMDKIELKKICNLGIGYILNDDIAKKVYHYADGVWVPKMEPQKAKGAIYFSHNLQELKNFRPSAHPCDKCKPPK